MKIDKRVYRFYSKRNFTSGQCIFELFSFFLLLRDLHDRLDVNIDGRQLGLDGDRVLVLPRFLSGVGPVVAVPVHLRVDCRANPGQKRAK